LQSGFNLVIKLKNKQIKSQVRHDSLILKLENKLKQHFIEANERKRKESFKMRNGRRLNEKVNWRRLLRRERPANGERSKKWGGKGRGEMKSLGKRFEATS
jgi:hypothetical protein